MPLHPRTKKIVQNLDIRIENITIIKPIGYLEMIYLIVNSEIVITDSGGLQKEAFFFQKPCVTLRDETEWNELLKYKFNVLVGANREKILYAYNNFLFATNFDKDLYGGGKASKKIVQELLNDK